MRTIAIIGAGQAGLLLAIGLLGRGYRVTLVSDRTREDILHGPVPAGAIVFDEALALERELGINFWDDVAVFSRAVHIDLVEAGSRIAFSIEAALDKPALCVDQRLKSSRWMQEFERRGGRLIVKPATVSDLEGYAREHDLVVVAAGKGEISHLFPRDDARSPFDAAARQVSMVVVTGCEPWDNYKLAGPKFMLLPGVGEIFSAPIYAKDEVRAIFLGYESIPGGPMDRFTPGMSPAAQLELSKQIFRDLVPWDHAAIQNARLVDDRACLFGKIVPIVRKAAGTLPSGARVLGIADAVNVHDPIAAQGANNAGKTARTVRDRIVLRGDQPFDAEWMADVFEETWGYTQYANLLCQKLLLPPEPHVLEILGAASQNPRVAARFINGFSHPPDLFPWFADAGEAGRFLQSLAA
jgi:hypothetical protein